MPSTYAHYRFGCEVYCHLPEEVSARISKYRTLYLTGLHGPDLMFYYRPLCANPVNQIGYQLHDWTGREMCIRDRMNGTWRGPGVYNIEEFDPDPFMDALNRFGLPWKVSETPELVED